MGKPLILWLMDGLDVGPDDTLVIAYPTDLERWRMEDRLRKALPNVDMRIVHLAEATRGAADTVRRALARALTHSERSRKTMLFDCDSFYKTKITDTFRAWPRELNMSVVFRDEGTSPIYSYCDLSSDGRIRRIQEKERIAPWANTGCYSFASGETLLRYCQGVLTTTAAPAVSAPEVYMSSVIAAMLSDDHPFQALPISSSDFVCLGTPLQLRLFCSTGPSFAARRICFDLDGTLVTHPVTPGDYASVRPYTETIAFARYLKRLGNTIVVHTARGMRSAGGNPGVVQAQAAKAVHATLEKFGIPCDELYLGKPYADVYVDDLAHNVCDDLQKATGFYATEIAERKHNALAPATIRTLVKRSTEPLDGEIHWYTHIPSRIRHLFPAFIRSGPDGSWYEVERLECTTCANLLVNECLTPEHLVRILESLRELHESVGGVSKPAELYANYAAKVKARFDAYDYGRFPNAQGVYDALMDRLQAYADADGGYACVVHGDPVLSNVLMERGEQIRFIDMRGKLGSVTTIFGDRSYDYAKVYQSLVGYDEILLDRQVRTAYRDGLLAAFSEEVRRVQGESAMDTVRLLAASLFFTLIPLHDNDKCSAYFEKCVQLLS
jgi:capsule biosynthesis phosphatase